jgi:magnesium chelatase family protein
MSFARTYSRASLGMQAPEVVVEVHLSNGLPCFTIVGLPETSVKESKERVRSALVNSQFLFPDSRITVNLAPADLPKDGGRFDLAIAIGILLASGQLQNQYI